MCDPRVYPHATERIEIVETHISWVVLTGPFAYKIKKPVEFPFVDFSTLERRKRFCDDELRLNRRLAPELYLDVVPVGGTREAPRIDASPAFEYAVKMRQFPPEQTLDRCLERGRVPRRALLDLAERMAAFHAGLASVRGRPVERVVLDNLDELASVLCGESRERLEPIAAWTRQRTDELGPWLRLREAQGATKECHGDLHLGNLVWLEDRIVPFDCLEFSHWLRRIDTVDEIAFLAMDLMVRDRTALAFEFVNRYLEVTGDYAGVSLLRFYLVYRALVRSKVRALAAAQQAEPPNPPGPTPYLDLAERLVAASQPLIVITHGFSGSGKTTVTSELLGRIAAVRVRSDLERKRRHGLEPHEDSGSGVGTGIYTTAASDETYALLARAAEPALEAGIAVIVDAAFLERRHRAAFAALAERHGARLVVLDFTVDANELRERVVKRARSGADASEAGLAVLERQLAQAAPIQANEPGILISVDTGAEVNVAELAEAIVRAGG